MGRASNEKEEFWSFVLSEQSQSGQSVREFCRQEGVSEASFYQWRKKLGRHSEAVKQDFLPVKIVATSPCQQVADNAPVCFPASGNQSDSARSIISEPACGLQQTSVLEIAAPGGFFDQRDASCDAGLDISYSCRL